MSKNPRLKEATVSHGCSVNCNLGKNTYESYKVNVSKSLTLEIPEEMSDVEVAEFLAKERELIKEELDQIIQHEYTENSCYAE